MIIDYQSIYNLELVETKSDALNPEIGSLLHFLNRASTPFGKREFKRILLNPLTNIEDILMRQQVVDDFTSESIYPTLVQLRKKLKKIPDLERNVSKFYKFAMQSNKKAVYFENISKNRLNDFVGTLSALKKSMEIFELFSDVKQYMNSELLIKLTTLNDEVFKSDDIVIKGIIPNIVDAINGFENQFNCTGDKDNLSLEPNDGADPRYDEAKKILKEIENELEEELEKNKKILKCPSINFNSGKAFRFELEIPEKHNIPEELKSNYKLTSTRKVITI